MKFTEHLVPLLKDTELHLYVRRTACEVLQKLAADEVKLKDHIVPLLKDTDWDVCRTACEKWGKRIPAMMHTVLAVSNILVSIILVINVPIN